MPTAVTTGENTELTELDLRVINHYAPRHDRILCRPILAPEKTSGGIYLPDATRERDSLRAVVLAVGPGRVLDNGTRLTVDGIKSGDIVAYPIMGGTPFHVERTEYSILRDAECILKISKEGGAY